MIDMLCLIDAKNLCYRAGYVHRFLSSRGRPTGVLYGVLKMLVAVANKMQTTAFVFIWDGEGKTWRHELTNGFYKGNRGEMSDDAKMVFPQIPILRKVLRDAGFRQFEVANLECDDLIGILSSAVIAKNLFERVVIYSTDRDFYQLATDRVGVLRGAYHNGEIDYVMFAKEVTEEACIGPRDWIKVHALTGDPTDNIPKIQTGLGPKTAIKMIQAGLDPTKEQFKEHQWVVRQNFGVLASQWSKIRQNYVLSKIIQCATDSHLSVATQNTLMELEKSLTKDSFLRMKKKLTDESFSEFTEFVVEYEMTELFGQRQQIWRMP